MNTLCIVPCGNRKIWSKNPETGPTKARDVYIGPFAKKCREYAETFYPDCWCILSAKYGFIFPEDIIPENYNVTFLKPKTCPITIAELRNQATQKGLLSYPKIVVLGGRNYSQIVEKTFPGVILSVPLTGCKGIGYMMGRLKTAIEKGVPL